MQALQLSLAVCLGVAAACEGENRREDPAAAPGPPMLGDPRERCLEEVGEVSTPHVPIVRALCADLVNLRAMGASLAIAERGRLTLGVGVGIKRHGSTNPIELDTPFRIGSITKMMTARLALSLENEGKLALDDLVVKHLPQLTMADPAFRTITLRHLLTHTSGIRDQLPTPQTGKLGHWDWLATLKEERLLSPPGEHFSYSNTGYYIAGMVLERAGGRAFETLMREHVIDPAGLKRSTVSLREAMRMGAACGHMRDLTGVRPYNVLQDFRLFAHGAWWTVPAGGMLASAEDLVMVALAAGPDLPPLSELVAGGVPTHTDSNERYGLGVRWRRLEDGSLLLHHSGNTGDFSADLYAIPERGFAMALLSNGERHFRATLRAALEALAGVQPPARAAQASPP